VRRTFAYVRKRSLCTPGVTRNVTLNVARSGRLNGPFTGPLTGCGAGGGRGQDPAGLAGCKHGAEQRRGHGDRQQYVYSAVVPGAERGERDRRVMQWHGLSFSRGARWLHR
jgi:hypothetical protein